MKRTINIKDLVNVIERKKSLLIRESLSLKKHLKGIEIKLKSLKENSIVTTALDTKRLQTCIRLDEIESQVRELDALKLFLSAFSYEFEEVDINNNTYFKLYLKHVETKTTKNQFEQNLLNAYRKPISDSITG